MAALLPVDINDTVDQLRIKLNDTINTVNNLQADSENVFALVDPLNQDDIFVYKSSTQKFENKSISALVTEVLNQSAAAQSQNIKPFYLANLRTVF